MQCGWNLVDKEIPELKDRENRKNIILKAKI